MSATKQPERGIDLTDANAVVVVSPVKVSLSKEAAAKLAGASEGAADKTGAAHEDARSVTEHAVHIGGESVAYTATTGTITLAEEQGKAKARLFYTAYTRRDVEDPSARPITFTFNGGPGSSSVWLHMGAFGPRRVAMPDDASLPRPPYPLVDNLHSILDLTDLVFIDPVSTGYSRAAEGEDPSQFHGVTADVESVGELIRLYTTREKRWASPKFLAGESYGTTRAANLVNHMQERHGMFFNGVVLVSSVLHFNTLYFHPDNDLPFLLYVPAYTATAWYHGCLAPELLGDGSPEALRAALDEAEAFALGEYARALLLGTRLAEEERRRVARAYARLTGLSASYVERCGLRVELGRFVKELRRDEARTVGRLDSRYLGMDRDAAGERFEYDPSMSAIMGPYTGSFNHYVREELGFESDLPYEILTGKVHPWSFDVAQNRYLDVAEPLRQAMHKNPHLKVFVANGYYDMATPYFATEHTFSHLGLDASLEGNVSMAYYPAGHMMYVHEPSLARLKADLVGFFGDAVGA
ncbi:MAG: peptidase S10 [Caldilineae bacterium]|nr:peptidase S10 [Chloroflexota bacterium]MCB9176387.1 peptidase S10 [Caldilineae bacterium]